MTKQTCSITEQVCVFFLGKENAYLDRAKKKLTRVITRTVQRGISTGFSNGFRVKGLLQIKQILEHLLQNLLNLEQFLQNPLT